MDTAAVAVRDLGKTFHVPRERYTTVRERLVDRFRPEPPEVLRALDRVSFEVRRGEFFGIAGRNGSGKSTLLRCIAGIYEYDEGAVEVRGRLAPFIERGIGFKPDMTARENALISGIMLGLTREEARRRLDSVIAFAGLEDFAEMKLRNFSSGMAVRLAFSVTIQVEADVVLVDEVLAVGDAAFQERCYEELERLKGEGRTVLFVTHGMDALREHCDRMLLLDRGRVESIGAPDEIVDRYEEISSRDAERQRARAEETAIGGGGTAPVLPSSPATYRPLAVGESLRHLAGLTANLAVSEFRQQYLSSALGYVWSVLRPLLYFAILYAVFSNVTGIGSGVEHYPVYLLSGIVLWTFFAETASRGVTSLTGNAPMLRKMRFPRLAIPVSVVLRALFNLGINLVVVAAFVLAVGIEPRLTWLEVPMLIGLLAIFAAGIAMLLSALFVRYRDVSEMWQVASQFLFFGSPILYVGSRYPDAIQGVLSVSPLAAILTEMRHAMIDPAAPSAAESVGGAPFLLIPFAIVAGLFGLGLWFFNREAPRVAERL